MIVISTFAGVVWTLVVYCIAYGFGRYEEAEAQRKMNERYR